MVISKALCLQGLKCIPIAIETPIKLFMGMNLCYIYKRFYRSGRKFFVIDTIYLPFTPRINTTKFVTHSFTSTVAKFGIHYQMIFFIIVIVYLICKILCWKLIYLALKKNFRVLWVSTLLLWDIPQANFLIGCQWNTFASLATRTRFTRFTFITSGGGYSKSVGYKRTLIWFRYIYLVPSPHLSNIYKMFFLNHQQLLQYYVHFS